MKLFVTDKDFRQAALQIDSKRRLFNMLIVSRKMIEIFENQEPNSYNGTPNYRCWAGYVDALKAYSNEMLKVCKEIHNYKTKYELLEVPESYQMPPFTERTFLSHRAFLINLDYNLYYPKFGDEAKDYNGGVLIWEYPSSKDPNFIVAEDRNGFVKEEKLKKGGMDL